MRTQKRPDRDGGTLEQAKQVCLRLLTDRAHSRAELTERLARHGFRADVAEAALERLAEVGLIDDAAFARQWVASRHTHAGRGRRSLAAELRSKGIGEAESSAALAAVTVDDERVRAAELVRRKLRGTEPPADRLDRDRLMRRLIGMLVRRGYDGGLAMAVVREEMAAVAHELSAPDPAEDDPMLTS